MNSKQTLCCPNLVWNDITAVCSFSFVWRGPLHAHRRCPYCVQCTWTYEILPKQHKNTSCVCVWVSVCFSGVWNRMMQLLLVKWEVLSVETVPAAVCSGSFMMKLCSSLTETFSKCQPNAAIYMRMALPHSRTRPGRPLSDNDDRSILHEDSNSRSTGQTGELKLWVNGFKVNVHLSDIERLQTLTSL